MDLLIQLEKCLQLADKLALAVNDYLLNADFLTSTRKSFKKAELESALDEYESAKRDLDKMISTTPK